MNNNDNDNDLNNNNHHHNNNNNTRPRAGRWPLHAPARRPRRRTIMKI